MTIKDTILVIEDEERILRFMISILKREGYRILTANSGSEAYSMIESYCPIVSARTTEKDKVEALDAGADDYICKPFGT